MRRATVLALITGAIVIGGVVMTLQAKERKPTPAQTAAAPAAQAAPAPAATDQPAPGGETVAFTFPDDTQMQEFARLWQTRQATLARMAVLQAYWGQEQAGLGTLNQQLLSQYNLDVKKTYTLDPERKVLIERPGTTEQPPPQLGE